MLDRPRQPAGPRRSAPVVDTAHPFRQFSRMDERCDRCAELAERLAAAEAAHAEAAAAVEVAARLAAVGRELVEAMQKLDAVLEHNRREGSLGAGFYARVDAQRELGDCRDRAVDVLIRSKLAILQQYVHVEDVAGFIEHFALHAAYAHLRDTDVRAVLARRVREGTFPRGRLVGD